MLLTVAAENFLPFRRRVEYPAAGLGLVRVLGDNHVSGAADSNGVGKSALLSAIAFGRYGRAPCGRAAAAPARHASRPTGAAVSPGPGSSRTATRATSTPGSRRARRPGPCSGTPSC